MENDKISVQGIKVDLFSVLSVLFGIMFLSAVFLWAVAWNLVNTNPSNLSSVTFSSVLGSEEELRIIYAAWLALYASVSVFLLYLVFDQPISFPHLHDINGSCAVVALNDLYGFLVITKFTGLIGVLLCPITDPDPDVELAHYLFAGLAFGSAIGISWVLFGKRLIYKDHIMYTRGHLLTWLNFVYCIAITGVAIWFIDESFEEDYVRDKGYIEFVLTLVCVFDRVWQLADFYDDTLQMVVYRKLN